MFVIAIKLLFESYILSETVVYEIKKYDKDISANGVLSIPVKFKDGGDGIWHGESGELNHIIISLNALLDISNSETPVYITQLTDKIDNVYIEHIYEGLDEILMSEIITYTVIDEVKKLNGNGINIPNEYMNEHNIWLNEYNSQNVLIKEGEVARFMSGVYTALNLSSETRTPVKSIEKNGEEYFRKIEAETAKYLSEKYKNTIISTGGGVGLNPDNMLYLKKTGVVVYISRTVENILSTLNAEKRPLLKSNPEKLYEMYEKRHPLYSKYADICVLNSGSFADCVENICEAIKLNQ